MLWTLALLPAAGGLAAGLAPAARPWQGAVAGGVLAATLLLAGLAVAGGWDGALVWSGPLRLTAALTPASAAMVLLVPAIALPILLYAVAHEAQAGLRRLSAVMLLFVAGMQLLVIADDFLTLLIGWELVGACSWALIGHYWQDRANPQSGLYAFIATRLGDLGLFVSAMAVFAGSGSLAFDALSGLEAPYLSLAAFGLLVSAAAKSGQLPFAPWLFRAMAGPTPVSALLHAATMVAAGAYVLIRLQPALQAAPGFDSAVLALGLATALTAGVVGVLQNHAKRLLAASTSAHYGLMFVAVGAGYPGIALLHLVAHAGFKALLFLAAGIAGHRAGSFRLERMGFGRALPLAAAVTAVGTLALAGMPPLGGAWTKEAVVAAAGHHAAWAAVAAMLAGALSAAYAVRFHLLAFGHERAEGAGSDGDGSGGRPPAGEYAGLGLLAALSVAISALWVPWVADWVAALTGIEVPAAKTWEVVASFALLALALVGGWLVARRWPALGAEGTAARAADWLQLPAAIRTLVTRPVAGLAGAAARADDRVVDAGVALAAAFGEWLARLGQRVGETLTDGLPEGSARLVGLGGRNARRLQTGLSHHYYALIAVGTLAAVAALALGS
jgi:NADH:ubiquinone oxidoreductase subunit 5 (subunit L)/multisubunit Na+/H+ antiporter MnhA subunit